MRLSSLACFLATLLGVHGAVRYNKVSLCETTPDTNAYSGYIDLDDQSHLFFWFFEARRGTETAPITLWLNGGPGTDSLLGLFTGMVFS
jgi:carboxypeptidase D